MISSVLQPAGPSSGLSGGQTLQQAGPTGGLVQQRALQPAAGVNVLNNSSWGNGPTVTPTPVSTPTQQTGPTAAEIAAQEQAAADALSRRTIEANFADYTNALQGQKTRLGETQNVLADRIGSQYAGNVRDLNLSRDQGQANIARAQEKVRLRGAETLKDLASNIRSAFDAGNIRLGTSGASDSSASGQMAYALARLQNQNRADVMSQGNEQLADLDFEEMQMLQSYNAELQRLNDEKENSIADIALDFQSKIDAINAEMVNANIDRRTALAQLKVEVANDALSNIAGMDRDINSYISDITRRVNQGVGDLEAAKKAISGISSTSQNFAPTTQLNLAAEDTQFRPTASALGTVDFFRPARRDEE